MLAERLPDAGARGQLWVAVEDAGRALPTLRGLAGHADPVQAMALVQRAPIGNLDGLLRCVRHDVLSWTWDAEGRQEATAERATAVLCDAVVSAYLRDQLDPAVRRRLAAGWVAAVRRLPANPPIDLGPHHHAVTSLLDRVQTLSSADVARIVRVADDGRRQPSGWSSAAHSASWAGYLSGRIRTAAAAQFLLVQAVDTGAVPLSDRAGGVWNLLSGAVQALVVRDLLDTGTAHRLLAPALAALGPNWLR